VYSTLSIVVNWGKQFLRSSTDKEYQGLQNSANGSLLRVPQLFIFCDVLVPNEPVDIKAIPNEHFFVV
jgi:hypothetical protein